MTTTKPILGKWRIKPSTYNPDRVDTPDARERLLSIYSHLKNQGVLKGVHLYVSGDSINSVESSVLAARSIGEAREHCRREFFDEYQLKYIKQFAKQLPLELKEELQSLQRAGSWKTVLDLVTDSEYWSRGLECIAERALPVWMGEMYIDTPAKFLLKIVREKE